MNRSPIFDTVRQILGRSFRSDEIRRLDTVVDCWEGDDAACEALVPKTVGPKGLGLIKRFEGCARLRTDGLVEAYPDPGTGSAPWTIGWGATGPGIEPGTLWTQAQCDERLRQDVIRYAREVAAAIGDAPTSQPQFDALVSFHYNTGAIGRATLTARHREGDYAAAVTEFARWNRAGGRVLKGLTRRRVEEARLYASADQ